MNCKKTKYELFERGINIVSSERWRHRLGGRARNKQSSVRAARGGGVGQDRVAGTVCPQWELCARAIVVKPEGIFLPVWAQNRQYFVFAMSAVLLCFSICMVSLFLPWKKYGKDIFQSFFCPPVVGDRSCSVEACVTGEVTWKQFSLIVTIVTHLFKELGK